MSGQHVTPEAMTRSAAPPPRARNPVAALALSFVREWATLLITVALVVIFIFVDPTFLTWKNFQSIFVFQTVTTCITLGILFPLIVGEFDLSVGYLVGFIGMLGAFLAEHGWSTLPVLVVMILAGIFVGLVNGFLTERLKISAFIATLGTGIVLQGLTEGLSGGSILVNNIPKFVVKLAQGQAGGLAICVWITLGLAVILFYVLEQTPLGRNLYAVGGSPRVAFLAGLRVSRLKVFTFAASGLLVAVGAIIGLGQNGSASPAYGPDLLLPAYAAAFLSVTTYRGGYFNVAGAIVGILLLAIGFNGLSLMGVPFWVQPVFNGAVLIVAVAVARAESRQVRV